MCTPFLSAECGFLATQEESLVTHAREEGPYGASLERADNHGVSMYVDILSSAMDVWVEELTGDSLTQYALACRSRLATLGLRHGNPATVTLAAEIAYDRALIRLCETHGVDVAITNFAFAKSERARIESRLARIGVDLAATARAEDAGPPVPASPADQVP
jgi:hypothetical protein